MPKMMIIMVMSEDAGCPWSRHLWPISIESSCCAFYTFTAKQKPDLASCGRVEIDGDESTAGQTSASQIHVFQSTDF